MGQLRKTDCSAYKGTQTICRPTVYAQTAHQRTGDPLPYFFLFIIQPTHMYSSLIISVISVIGLLSFRASLTGEVFQGRP